MKDLLTLKKTGKGLIQYIFNKKIKAQKLKDIIKKGQPAVPVDEVRIETDEYPKYLKMAYKEEKFPKPRNFIGMAKDLPDTRDGKTHADSHRGKR